MPRAAFLFVFVGLFALAWSNDPGLAAAPRPAPAVRSRPVDITPVPTPADVTPPLTPPMAELPKQCDATVIYVRPLPRYR